MPQAYALFAFLHLREEKNLKKNNELPENYIYFSFFFFLQIQIVNFLIAFILILKRRVYSIWKSKNFLISLKRLKLILPLC